MAFHYSSPSKIIPLFPSWEILYLFSFISVTIATRMHAKSLQLCLTLCDPIDCSPRGSSSHGIFQARILQWVAMPLSRGFSQPRYGTCISCLLHWQAGSLPPAPPGKPPKPIYLYPYLYHTYTNIHGLPRRFLNIHLSFQ